MKSDLEILKEKLLEIRYEGITLENYIRHLSEEEKEKSRKEYKERLHNIKKQITKEKIKQRSEENDQHKR